MAKEINKAKIKLKNLPQGFSMANVNNQEDALRRLLEALRQDGVELKIDVEYMDGTEDTFEAEDEDDDDDD